MWRLLWHDRWAGLRIGRCRKHVGDDRSRSSAGAFRGGTDAEMIVVVLPAHLRALAGVSGYVQLEIDGEVTRGSILDALEARFPMLRGTIRQHVGGERRPLLRFFACGEDVTHEASD